MIDTLHTVLVVAFVAVTLVLFGVTLLHRIRVRQVLMTWRASTPVGASAWPILFVGAVILLLVFARNTGSELPTLLFAGYVLGGVLWFGSVVIASTVIVTSHGIVHGISRLGQALAWVQVADWFEVPDGRRTHFVLMYDDVSGSRQRIEVSVPYPQADRFRRIIRQHIDESAAVTTGRVTGKKALEG